MKRWCQGDTDRIRADALAGWTLEGCARLRGFHEGTVSKHAKLNGIVFPVRSPDGSTVMFLEDVPDFGPEFLACLQRRADAELAAEVSAARDELNRAPLYRGGGLE